jgi:Zn-dependent M28 family amino/carboxypeptidase
MLDPIDRSAEEELIDAIDPDELEHHVDAFVGLERMSGTAAEREASEYVVETLKDYGVSAKFYEHDALISVPDRARVEVTVPRNRTMDGAITISFSASTSPAGVHGEVVRLETVSEETVDRAAVEGKIVFTEGLPTPDPVCLLDDAGAAALIMASVTEGQVHEMIASPLWGTPSTETADALPNLPVAEIHRDQGEWLRDRLEEGPVEATVETQVTTETTVLPCPVGWIDGSESDRYYIMGNHVDAWYEGITDNATAMAATLEVARIFAGTEPRRGLVFGFWPAHSTGRYAGSAWYADAHWLDLRENGVAYLHADLNGLRGADTLWYQHMAELEDEHLDAMSVADLDMPTEQEGGGIIAAVDRPGRNSDQSFWGAGLSSLLSGARLSPGTEEGGPIGGGWWWHTPADTRDKVDVGVMVEETKLYVAIASRICNSPVLPHDYRNTVDDVRSVLDEFADAADGAASFVVVRDRLDALDSSLATAYNVIDDRGGDDPELAAAAENLQVALGNQLIPALYMEAPEYEHDPALARDRLPSLHVADGLSNRTGRDRLFAETRLRRGTTRLAHRIGRATAATDRFIEAHGG